MGTSVRVFAEALCFYCREDTDLPSSIEMASNKEIGEKYGLHPRDVEKIKFAFEVYDFKGDGKVDGFYIGDLIRACNINPTNKTIDAVGGQKEKGKKIVTLEDMYPLFKAAKESKDTGGIHDFVEILKLYDKNEDKTILHKDLFRLLTNLGEKLSKEEAKGLMTELCDPQDDDGFTPLLGKDVQVRRLNLSKRNISVLMEGCAHERVKKSKIICAFLERVLLDD